MSERVAGGRPHVGELYQGIGGRVELKRLVRDDSQVVVGAGGEVIAGGWVAGGFGSVLAFFDTGDEMVEI